MPDSITAKTGNAKIKRFGQTKGSHFGSDNTQQPVGRKPVVDENNGR